MLWWHSTTLGAGSDADGAAVWAEEQSSGSDPKADGVAGGSPADFGGPLSIAERDSERLHFNKAASLCFA